MTDGERIEELARALFDERKAKYKHWHDDWNTVPEIVRNDWRDSARLAIPRPRRRIPTRGDGRSAVMQPALVRCLIVPSSPRSTKKAACRSKFFPAFPNAPKPGWG
jgi:hypothetical protein